ncbi:MAG: PTS sugar transporter subunit IIA [Gammaproteobacteria bacterium]|nr:PTS sugar transporter subunit IIA [Gammaproteobacteria bacterium]MDH5801540.1 PTS sugar transporter subunit IIA [Gammaproteobacteria bacterium]
MTVSVLLITHENLGKILLEITTRVLGVCPLQTDTLCVPFDSDPDQMLAQAQAKVETMNSGDGVLILTDMFGATPSNIAHKLSKPEHVMVVTGLNMPMMMRVMNYPDLTLTQLVEIAVDGGKDGVLFNRREIT